MIIIIILIIIISIFLDWGNFNNLDLIWNWTLLLGDIFGINLIITVFFSWVIGVKIIGVSVLIIITRLFRFSQSIIRFFKSKGLKRIAVVGKQAYSKLVKYLEEEEEEEVDNNGFVLESTFQDNNGGDYDSVDYMEDINIKEIDLNKNLTDEGGINGNEGNIGMGDKEKENRVFKDILERLNVKEDIIFDKDLEKYENNFEKWLLEKADYEIIYDVYLELEKDIELREKNKWNKFLWEVLEGRFKLKKLLGLKDISLKLF